jgi:hypothetical protein
LHRQSKLGDLHSSHAAHIDRIVKETEPGESVIDLVSVDKLQRQVVTVSLDSDGEYRQERSPESTSGEEESN